MHLQLLLLASGFAWNILGCQAGCNVCSPDNNVACISTSTFQFCDDNQPYGAIYSCPTGSFCTDNSKFCDRNASLSACNDCGKCNVQKTFACVGLRTFALCKGTPTPSDMVFNCEEGLVCKLDSPEICVDESETSTCSKKNDDDALGEYCKTAYNGNIRYPVPKDNKCTSFVYCEYYTMDLWKGSIIECPEETPFFNGRTQSCSIQRTTGRGCT